MNRRSHSVKEPKFCLVRYEEDEKLDVFRTERVVTTTPVCVGAIVEAPFKGKLYSAVVLALNGTLFSVNCCKNGTSAILAIGIFHCIIYNFDTPGLVVQNF